MSYWYLTITHYCVCCGREDVYKQRMYTPKPESAWDRYRFYEYLCYGCLM